MATIVKSNDALNKEMLLKESIADSNAKLSLKTDTADMIGSNRINSNVLSSLNLQNGVDFKGVGSVTTTIPSTNTGINRYGVLEDVAIDSTFHNEKGMRFDRTSTNYIIQSIDLSDVAWFKENVTLSTDGTKEPSGINDAVLLTCNTVDGNHRIRPVSNTAQSIGVETSSVYIKEGTHPYIAIYSYSSDASSYGVFDFTQGDFSTTNLLDSYNVEPLANGWYRISITQTTTADNGVLRVGFNSNSTTLNINWLTSGTETVYIANPQVEEGSTATSYIPTATTAVTRLQSVTSFPTKNNMPDISKGAGFFMEFTPSSLVDSADIFSISGFGNNDQIRLFLTSDSLKLYIKDSGIAIANRIIHTTTTTTTESIKVGVSFNTTGLDYYVNNVYEGSIAYEMSVGFITNIVTAGVVANLGTLIATLSLFTGYIKSIKWVDYTPTPTEMAMA